MEIPGYEIERCLAQGATAAAYLATQISLGRPVVLKVLDTALADTPQALQRFLNEGRLIAGLRHPHIVTIHDIGTAGRLVYLSMEYVEGGDLKQRLAEGPLPPGLALEVLEKIASALGYAHAHGVIHRDVKPGNILFRRDGAPVLTDFGIAKSLKGDGDLTGAGIFLGSPNYMAPEQVDSGSVDHGADIYALGIILYEMLTGRKPFVSGSIIDVIYAHRKAPMPPLPAPFEALQGLMDLMTAKSRSERFRDIDALLHYLGMLRRRGVLAALEGAAPAAATLPSSAAPRGARPRVALLAALLVALLGYGALFVVERRLAAPDFAIAPAAQAHLPVAAPTAAPAAAGAVATDEIVAALLWLGRHSISEFRLSAPPKDNAYYYFTRLRQIAPDHPGVGAGFRDMATAYALLAERAIAAGDPRQARAFLALARQLDPANAALPALSELADSSSGSVWRLLRGWLRAWLG
ncbi:MAG TPA: serine/threonine-protein kinase [Gammaproteobacteria bacterium]|nr:serine/threonine-protein kinase [Gammaproteobacteria bacterium]